MRVVNKRRFSIACFILGVLLFLLCRVCISVVYRYNHTMKKKDVVPVFHSITLTGEKQTAVVCEESKFFKRYVITCQRNISQLKQEETEDSIKLFLRTEDITPANLSILEKRYRQDFSISKMNQEQILNIKKKCIKENYVYVNPADQRQVIILLSKSEQPYIYAAVIDPGHGGIDKGANIGTVYEKDITLKIALGMENSLRFYGCKAVYTRSSDKLLALKEIGRFVNQSEANVFISVHVNSFKQSEYQGVTTFYYNASGNQGKERISLAQDIQAASVEDGEWGDRGIMEKNLAVLRYSKIPCVLVECGFLTNPEDFQKLQLNKSLQNLSDKIAQGVNHYLTAVDESDKLESIRVETHSGF